MTMMPVLRFTLIALLAGIATIASADHRPFGVLPEGNIRLDSPAAYDAVVTLSDGRLLVEGDFTRADGERVAGPVLLDPNGRLLRALSPRCVGQTVVPGRKPCRLSMLALPDGGFVVAGAFEAIDGEPVAGIARYRADAALDTAFRPISLVTAEQQPALIGARLGHLYFRSTASSAVQRIGLEPPYAIDPNYLAANPGASPVLDNTGRLYEIESTQSPASRVRRRQPSGAIDPDWQAELPSIAFIRHDPVTDGVFLLSDMQFPPWGRIAVRAHPSGGLDPDWRLAHVPTDGGQGIPLPVGVGAGRILSEQFDGSTRWLASHDAASGRLLRAVPLPVPRGAAFFATGESAWIATLGRFSGNPGAGLYPDLSPTNQLVRVDATLAVDPALDTSLHEIGATFAAGPGLAGGWFVGGAFSGVNGVFRNRIARLAPGWEIDRDWRHDFSARALFPVWRVGQTSDGTVVAGEFQSRILQPIDPKPYLLLATPSGSPAQRRWIGGSPSRSLVLGAHVYGSELCQWPLHVQPRPATWRVPVSQLLPPAAPGNGPNTCAYDFTWRADGGMLAPSPDGWLYYAQSLTTGMVIRRIRTDAQAQPDPNFLIALPPPPAQWSFHVAGLAATRQHVYVSLIENASAGGRVLRYLASNGQIDPTWPTVTRVNATERIAADEEWLYLWDQAPANPTWRGPWELTRRSAIDGRATGTLRAVEGTLQRDAGHPDPEITAIGDGRAIASWRFILLDGVPRDGFAIVGSVEAILVDDFEESR